MNREINFRGKDKTGIMYHDWFYGYLDFTDDLPKIICKDGCDNKMFITVDENTIGQFTGLYDKNGKEIYEGDIVKSTYREVRDYSGTQYEGQVSFIEKVVWSKDYNGWCLQIEDEGIELYRRFNFCEEVNNYKLVKVEIIGNIFDNPELLKGENDENN